MLSLNYENINYVMTQILKLSCASFSYVNISYVLAQKLYTLMCHKQMEFSLPIKENLLHPMAQLLNNRTDTFYPLSDHSVFFTMLASLTEAWCSLLGSLDKNRPSSYF